MERERPIIDNLPTYELKLLALDIFKNNVFTDAHLHEHEFHMVPSIFVPIAMGCPVPKNIGMAYEYYSKALPRGINGLPMFMSVNFVNEHDAKVVAKLISKLRRKEEAMLKDGGFIKQLIKKVLGGKK